MGCALSQDSMNQEQGVFIDNPTSTDSSGHEMLSGHLLSNGETRKRNSTRSLRDFSSPFVGKVIQYMDRHQVPFEHVDAWVPSFIPTGDQPVPTNGEQQKCRLCFAGFATTDFKVPADGGRAEPMNSQDQFDLLSFGEYSSKFSFDVGCGLPGRVYSSGICSWEQGIPTHQVTNSNVVVVLRNGVSRQFLVYLYPVQMWDELWCCYIRDTHVHGTLTWFGALLKN